MTDRLAIACPVWERVGTDELLGLLGSDVPGDADHHETAGGHPLELSGADWTHTASHQAEVASRMARLTAASIFGG